MTSSRYVYDQAWEQERARLAGLERLWDPGTQEVLSRVGVDVGAAVLEAGAGGGSVVEWIAARVGGHGRVVALDLDVRFVEPLRSSVVQCPSSSSRRRRRRPGSSRPTTSLSSRSGSAAARCA